MGIHHHWLEKRNKDASTMMTSSNGSIFRFTGPMCGEFTDRRWIPLTKASDEEFWCFLWCTPEQTVEQTSVTPVIKRHRAHYDVTIMYFHDLVAAMVYTSYEGGY